MKHRWLGSLGWLMAVVVGFTTQSCSLSTDGLDGVTNPLDNSGGNGGTGGGGQAGMSDGGHTDTSMGGEFGMAGQGGMPGGGTGGGLVLDREPTPNMVSCGAGICDLDVEFCCQTDQSSECMDISKSCTVEDGVSLSCDGPEDCPDGRVCCGALRDGFANNTCVAPSVCVTVDDSDQLCHNSDQCAGTLSCCAATLGNLNVGICRTRC